MKPRGREWIESVFKAGAADEPLDRAVIEWFAQDCCGRLGVFEAVGQPVLRATFHDLDDYLAAKDAVHRLPCVTQARVFSAGTRKQTAWCRRLAEGGLYVFDSWEGEDWRKGYRLVAAPAVPLVFDQLSEPLIGWFSAMRLKRAEFRLAQELPLDLSGKGMD